jgi:hypothetical protein
MIITYNDTQKNLPPAHLHKLFVAVGWSDGSETPEMIQRGYSIPWVNSTLVISAWDGDCLIGAVRVLSDTMFRSIIYDLIVLPEYQNMGACKELIRLCIEHFPNSEWLVQTTKEISGYYERNGFIVNSDVFLTVPCKLFTHYLEIRKAETK